ncbi:MAG: hydantoinase B/oxoprolinase family protein [Hyphomicrobiaceae bacterium]
MKIDNVTLEILKNHSRAAAESMAYTLYRTAHSTFVKETEDFTTGLTTPAGETFATPTELGATWFVGLNYGPAIRAIEQYDDGDIGMTNDPYSGFVCTHSPDMHIWKPIFHDSEIVAYSVGHIHNTDVGGAVPASLSRSLTEVHQEGIRLPPTKVLQRGELNRQVLDIYFANVRAPEQSWGDLKAQIAACNTGERKVREMIAKFGIDTFKHGIERLLDYAEAQARETVRGIPDGAYDFADYMDEDSVDGKPCRLRLRLIVEGDTLRFDFTGTDPQLESSLNIPTGGDERHTLLCVGMVYTLYSIDPTLFLNSGIARTLSSVLPTGTMINPQFPAAVGMRTLSAKRLQGVILGAFARALPDTMPAAAASGGPIMNINTTDNRTGRRVMAAINPMVGGAGGRAIEDGADGSGANQGFLKNTPVEVTEAEVPMRFRRYGLKCDSAGPGKHRGGLATEMAFQVFAPNTRITARNRDRTVFAGWGMQGGKPGANSAFILNADTEQEVNLRNTDIVKIGPGDSIYVACGGAAGYGDPLTRDPEAVLLDVRRGFVSQAGARTGYGVIVDNNSIDEQATRVERQRRGANLPGNELFDYGKARAAHEAVWTEANYATLAQLLARVPVHWRFYLKHRVFDALAALPADDRRGDGSDVRQVFAELLKEHPQLATDEVGASNGSAS